MRLRLLVALSFAIPSAAPLAAAVPTAPRDDAASMEFFEKKIRPVLVSNCYNCHSADTNARGGLRVDDRNGLIHGGDLGSAVVPGDPEKSLLIQAVRRTDDKLKMPPKKELSDEAVADLTTWIKNGAAWPQAAAVSLGKPNPKYDKLRKEHWAWQPLSEAKAPRARDASWARTDIDRFLQAKWEEKALSPVHDADMQGAISQMDTLEYKPQLQKDDGKEGPGGGALTASKFKFSQHGDTGTWVSELFPNVAKHVDKFCYLRGLHTDTPAHPQAVIQLHTGTALASLTRPSMGAWLMYGLGTENQDLPGYITINPPPNFGGAVNYGNAFLPAHFQGTRINDNGYVADLKSQTPSTLQRKQIDLIQEMNRDLAATPGAPDQVEGVIQSYELAFKMQGKAPALLDISKEPQSVLDAYGVKPGGAGSFARQCLMARRLSEAGVRFVEICHPGWDQHSDLHQGLIRNCAATDQPTAALLADLEQRGLLDETLVLFGSEFGRQPSAQGPDGRDHSITAYPMWLAGAGVKKGFTYGSTDEYGIQAVDGRMHATDLHATLLALMGLDHEKLTYRYAGRDFRLTDVAGNVAREIFA